MKTKLICTAVLALAASWQAAAGETLTAGCMNELVFEPRLSVIANKVNLTDAEAGVRSPNRVATTEERTALALWADLRKGCFEYGDAQRRADSKPEQIAFAKSVFTFQQRLVVELQAGNLTYAEFNRRRIELAQAAGQKI